MRKFRHVFLLAPKEMGSETAQSVAAADDPERLLAGAGAGSGGLRAGEACSRMRPTRRAIVDASVVAAVLAGDAGRAIPACPQREGFRQSSRLNRGREVSGF